MECTGLWTCDIDLRNGAGRSLSLSLGSVGSGISASGSRVGIDRASARPLWGGNDAVEVAIWAGSAVEDDPVDDRDEMDASIGSSALGLGGLAPPRERERDDDKGAV